MTILYGSSPEAHAALQMRMRAEDRSKYCGTTVEVRVLIWLSSRQKYVSWTENASLLGRKLGVTNLVARATANAKELSDDELRTGARQLGERLGPFRPRFVAILAIEAYRTGFGRPTAVLGPQERDLNGSRLWVLPNPSGANAYYPPKDQIELLRALRDTVAE